MPRRVFVSLAFILSSVPAWSQFTPLESEAAQKDPGAFTIDENTVRIDQLGPTLKAAEIPSLEGYGGGDATIILDSIINNGRKMWKIIVDNKPVVDVRTQYATALPEGVKGWASMGGWQPPKGMICVLTAKNVYGVTVLNVRYQVLRTYGGSYKGKGKYLTAVTVEPLLVEVAWGYKYTMEASVPDTSIVNMGTTENPLAAMMAQLSWRIQTAVKDSQGTDLYFLQGDGSLREIGGPFSSQDLEKARAAVDMARPEALR
ncbi:MAG TPA: hypothetical protein DCZ01_06815 [Elusimicrobia bacterium]|nr:MAG: hypothetical protein A2X37_01630 [Elusimicrobia bacterium GWA2_66_18]OGR74084.1 MAG: hypothetical protein A2X40_09055 [Elusimicrobia bacterium GWC2_65_9]HAZ08221.1 hypothetical protein [Elusimicrobiota bacterium]